VDNYSATSGESDVEQLLNTFATKHWGALYGEQMRLKLAGEALRTYKPEVEKAVLESGLVDNEGVLLDTAEGLIGGGISERCALKRYEAGLKGKLQKERLALRKAQLKSEQLNPPQ
jgi:hypothetical protein